MGKETSEQGPPALSERGARDLLNCVIEYLQYLQYHQTVQTLLAERATKRQNLNNSLHSARTQSKDARERIRAEMLRKFDEGRRDDFFTLWQQYVPAPMLGFDYSTQKLEFYLQVYFSIYPVLPSSSVLVVTPGPGSRLSAHSSSSRHELALRMKVFKSYLEGRGAGLAYTAEFLPYYALPYVPQPEHHPSFEGLFQSRWVDEQRLQLKTFLEGLTSRSAAHVPLLYVMYAEHLQATDGVPRLSPRARALRASTRAHSHASHPQPQSQPQSRESSRGSAGNGDLGPTNQHQHIQNHSSPGARSSGGHGVGLLDQHGAAATAAAAAPTSVRQGKAAAGPAASGMPPRDRQVSGEERQLDGPSPLPPWRRDMAAAGADGGPEVRGSGGGDDNDISGFVQDDDDGDGLNEEVDEEQRARVLALLRRRAEEEEDMEEEADEAAEAAIAEALRSPSNHDRHPAGASQPPAATAAAATVRPFPPVAPASVRGSVALSLERLGLTEDVVFRESVHLLGTTLGDTMGGGTLDLDMVSELMAAGAAAAAGARGCNGARPDDGNGDRVDTDGKTDVRFSRVLDNSCTGLAPLNYRHVKQDLEGPNTLLAARLLQALRWRLTRSRPGADRWGLIASWIEVDLLDCHSPTLWPPPGSAPAHPDDLHHDQGPWSLLRLLAVSDNPRVVEEVVRLANAIASDRMGRNYLMLPDGEAVSALMGVLRGANVNKRRPGTHAGTAGAEAGSEQEGHGEETAEEGAGSPSLRDGPMVQQALVALQKLSLKRTAQSQMIRLGAVAWVVEFLQDLRTVSPTAIEYGTALLMNLCLRSAGRVAAAAVATPLLQLCETLLTCEDDQVRTYVHGTLYSVFHRADVRDVAATRGTADKLEAVAQYGQAPFAAQSQYILRQLYQLDVPEDERQGPVREGSEVEVESDDEAAPDGDADLEAEEGLEDAFADVDIAPETLIRVPGVACGEELLCGGGYLAGCREAREHLSAVRSSVAAAAAVMAAVGKASLRGSVLLDSLSKAGGAARSAAAAAAAAPRISAVDAAMGRSTEAVGARAYPAAQQSGEERGEEDDADALGGSSGEDEATGEQEWRAGRCKGEADPAGAEVRSKLPSGDGGDDIAGAGHRHTRNDGYGVHDSGRIQDPLQLRSANFQQSSLDDGAPLRAPNDLDLHHLQQKQASGEQPNEDVAVANAALGVGGSGRASWVSRGGCAGGLDGDGDRSARPSVSSSSAYVALATSTANSSLMAAVRALEAEQLSGASASARGASDGDDGGDVQRNGGGTMTHGNGVGRGGDGAQSLIAAAASCSSLVGSSTARRRRSSGIRPITPLSPSQAAAAKLQLQQQLQQGYEGNTLDHRSSRASFGASRPATAAGGGEDLLASTSQYRSGARPSFASPQPGWEEDVSGEGTAFTASTAGLPPPQEPLRATSSQGLCQPRHPLTPPGLQLSMGCTSTPLGASAFSGAAGIAAVAAGMASSTPQMPPAAPSSRAGSRPHSPFPAGRGSLLCTSAMRRASESGSQILASGIATTGEVVGMTSEGGSERSGHDVSSPVRRSAAGVAAMPLPGSSRCLRRSSSANGDGGGSFSGVANGVHSHQDGEGSAALVARSVGPPATPPRPQLQHGQELGFAEVTPGRGSLGNLPPRASGAGATPPPAPPALPPSSRPGTAASSSLLLAAATAAAAAGTSGVPHVASRPGTAVRLQTAAGPVPIAETEGIGRRVPQLDVSRRSRSPSPASLTAPPHRASAGEGNNAMVASISPASSVTASPAGALTGPLPPVPQQLNLQHHHQHSRHLQDGSAAAPIGALAVTGLHAQPRATSSQGQPFPITAASSHGFSMNAAALDGGGIPAAASLHSSHAEGSSTAGTPREAPPQPGHAATTDTNSSAAAARAHPGAVTAVGNGKINSTVSTTAGGGGGGLNSGASGSRPRAIPRPPQQPTSAGRGAPSGARSEAAAIAAVGQGPQGAASTRSPTPPSGRSHQRQRMGPAPATGGAADDLSTGMSVAGRQLSRTASGGRG